MEEVLVRRIQRTPTFYHEQALTDRRLPYNACMHAPSHICELDAQTHEIHSVSLHGIVTPRCGVQSEAWLHPCADSAVGAQTHGRTESHAPVHPCVDSAAVLFFRKMFIKKLIGFLCENISLCFMKI